VLFFTTEATHFLHTHFSELISTLLLRSDEILIIATEKGIVSPFQNGADR
jgi:hypothetical protein